MPTLYPVIHYLDHETAVEQSDLIVDRALNGMFLISHHGDDDATFTSAVRIKERHPHLQVGVNLLATHPVEAAWRALSARLDMIWADNMGVSSSGLTPNGRALSLLALAHGATQFFASIAFKYQPHEPDPSAATRFALMSGFVPTTSGASTGMAPDLPKIKAMSQASQSYLAIASGITPDNLSDYAPHIHYVLVATGIARDAYRIDPGKLDRLISRMAAPTGILAH